MATGFQSNYNDSGYTLTGTGSWFDQSNNPVTSISSRDIYTTTELTGVYMINGSYDSVFSNVYYPIICSGYSYINLGIPNDSDDAWLVYPGFGFTLYIDINYSGSTQSRNYVNTSTVPVVYYNRTSAGSGWDGYGTPIYTTAAGNVNYPQNVTSSVKIYFRGTEIFVNGIS